MDTYPISFSVTELYSSLASQSPPLVVDVRRSVAFDADPSLILSATWRDPYCLDEWEKFLPRHRDIVVYCVHGHEISKNTCGALRALGLDARYLEGGLEAWKNNRAPVFKSRSDLAIPSPATAPSKWITRERPKIDRVACPWLIRRFIDPFAEFIYVPSAQVAAEAVARNAIPYDVPGVAFSHRGEQGEICSFDTLLDEFAIDDPALLDLARIVRGADTGRPDLTPESAGLLAVSLGLSALYENDLEMLAQGMQIYDALYAWLRRTRGEIHNAKLFATP